MSKSLELKKMLATLDEDRITREQFNDAFEKVIEGVEELRADHSATAQLLKAALKEALADIRKSYKDESSANKESFKDLTASLKQTVQQAIERIDAKIATVKDGVDADEDRVARMAADLVSEEIEIPEIEEIAQELPKLGSEIRNGLELLPEGEKLAISAIEGLEERLTDIKKTRGTVNVGGAVAARDFIKTIDLSAQLDGVTATFNLPAIYSIVSVATSSFPNILRPVVDYTWTSTSITFTSQIDPASTLAAGQTVILTVVTA